MGRAFLACNDGLSNTFDHAAGICSPEHYSAKIKKP